MDAENLRALLVAKAGEILARAAERAADPKGQHSAAALAGHAQTLLAAADVALLHFPFEEEAEEDRAVAKAKEGILDCALAWWWATRKERPADPALTELTNAIEAYRQLPVSNEHLCRLAQLALAAERGALDVP